MRHGGNPRVSRTVVHTTGTKSKPQTLAVQKMHATSQRPCTCDAAWGLCASLGIVCACWNRPCTRVLPGILAWIHPRGHTRDLVQVVFAVFGLAESLLPLRLRLLLQRHTAGALLSLRHGRHPARNPRTQNPSTRRGGAALLPPRARARPARAALSSPRQDAPTAWSR